MPESVLHVNHEAAGAEFIDFAGTPIVSTFGEPPLEYAAMHRGCGLIDLPQRGVFEVTGKDRLSFINNLITARLIDPNAKTPIADGRGAAGYLLNLQGRIVAQMSCLSLTDRLLIETDRRQIPMLIETLDRYRFTEKVKMIDLSDSHTHLALHGPLASVAAAGLNVSVFGEQLQCETTMWNGQNFVAWRDDDAGVPAVHLLIANEHAAAMWNHLAGQELVKSKRVRPIGWAVYNAVRIEGGRAMLGIDFDAAEPSRPGKKVDVEAEEKTPTSRGILPVEAGRFDQLVSVQKGCYLGQEIVARLHARKQVPRQIVGIRMLGHELPSAGAAVFEATGQTQIGIITSSTPSPILGDAAIGLTLLKKPHFTVGTQLLLEAEGARRGAEVVELPFVTP